MSKLRVAILSGGKSAEHEVSRKSAKNILAALDREKFEPLSIVIEKDGSWPLEKIINPKTGQKQDDIDVVFPVLHGPFGEDGSIQGLLRMANIPFVGAGVLGSAVGMDKVVMKKLLKEAGLPIGKFLSFNSGQTIEFELIEKTLGMPCFVKPANMGSSVGVMKVVDEDSLKQTIKTAFQFDSKIIIEEAIEGSEIECSVLGNDNPTASLPGRIEATKEFYSYEAKYLDTQGAMLEIPAKLDQETISRVQGLALKTFKTLNCSGLARVDMFLAPAGKLVINEINTLPGFTEISMYPKLWEVSGISYTELITKLIELALERHAQQQALKTSYN